MAYIGNPPITGNFQVCDAISVVNGQAAYTMQVSSANVTPESANHMLVSLNGVLQKPNSSFTISGSTITFASNLATGDVIDFIILLGNVLDLGVPSDATVTDAKANFVSTSSAAGLQIKGDGTTDGTLQLNCSQNSHGIKIASPAHSAGQSYTLKFPTGNVTADRFLKVDSVSGSGTTGVGQLSFAEVSSGTHQLISTATVSSSVSSIDLTGMDSTYQNYMVEVDNLVNASDNVNFELRFIQGGSTITDSNYWSQVCRQGISEGVINTEESANASAANIAHGVANNNNPQLNGRMFIYNAPTTDASTSFCADISLRHRDNHDHQKHDSHGELRNTAASTGITFKMSSGNITAGRFRLYGI